MQSSAIDICQLSKSFNDSKAIDNLSLNVPQGSIFGLIGPNGAGKSTLLQTLMGILHPDSGDVLMLGRNIRESGPDIRQEVGYVPDIPHMYPFFTANEMFLLADKLYNNWDRNKCRDLSAYFEIPANKRIKNLSRGIKVRAALVMALSIRPKLLILDEPTAGLDPVARRAFLKAMINEAAAEGTTVLYSTHNLNDLEQTADHIAAINHGKLLFTHSLEELKNSIHQYQVVFAGDVLPEETFKLLPGLIDCSKQGKIYTFTISCSPSDFKESLQAFNPGIIEPANLSLEDIFIICMQKEGYSFDYAV